MLRVKRYFLTERNPKDFRKFCSPGLPVLIKISTSKRSVDRASRTFPMRQTVYSYNFIEIPGNRNIPENKKQKFGEFH